MNIVFKYNGKSMFDLQLFDENDHEKEYVRITNSEEEKEEHLDEPVKLISEPQLEPQPEKWQHQPGP